jgi:hypothetical protein
MESGLLLIEGFDTHLGSISQSLYDLRYLSIAIVWSYDLDGVRVVIDRGV